MRTVLAIGCNVFDNPGLGELSGCEADAVAFHAAMLDDELGGYNAASSELLLSPTKEQVEVSLSKLYDLPQKDGVLTIFIASHGFVSHGNYYLCVKDTDPYKAAVTALSLSSLANLVNQVDFSEVNLVFDACQSGGVVNDIGSFLKPGHLGATFSKSIAIFSASCSDQLAMEIYGRGVATSELLKFIEGEKLLPSDREALGLVEIGIAASTEVAIQEGAQEPVVWGLNLRGAPSFVRNPNYKGEKVALSRVESALLPELSEEASREISNLYWGLPEIDDPIDITQALAKVLQELPNEPNLIASFLDGVSLSFEQRLIEADKRFQIPAMLAACLVATIPFLEESPFHELSGRLLAKTCRHLDQSFTQLLQQQKDAPHWLAKQGLADIFHLPLRIADILGWLGFRALLPALLGSNDIEDLADTSELLEELLANYSGALSAMSESQAPAVLVFAAAAKRCEWNEQLETVICSIFSDYLLSGGKTTRAHATGKQAFQYLVARLSGDIPTGSEFLAKPDDLMAVLMLGYELLKLEDTFDESLEALDHHSFNVFVANSLNEFGKPTIRNGKNHVFQVGHNLFRLREFGARWSTSIQPDLNEDRLKDSPHHIAAAIAACLLFRDRVPWFLLKDLEWSAPAGS